MKATDPQCSLSISQISFKMDQNADGRNDISLIKTNKHGYYIKQAWQVGGADWSFKFDLNNLINNLMSQILSLELLSFGGPWIRFWLFLMQDYACTMNNLVIRQYGTWLKFIKKNDGIRWMVERRRIRTEPTNGKDGKQSDSNRVLPEASFPFQECPLSRSGIFHLYLPEERTSPTEQRMK